MVLRLQPDGGGPSLRSRTFWLTPVVCTWVGLIGNSLLSAAKILVGLLAHSTALLADGFHSLADVLSDIGILLTLRAASRPPDAEHPYGHQSFETLGAIVVAAFMLLTAGLIGKEAIGAIVTGTSQHPGAAALGASLLSIVVKELMARYTLAAGRLHRSPALRANGLMHRSDAISSLAAAAGIGGAMAGWHFLDASGAIVIALFILKMGWDLMRENVMALMDTMPDEDLVAAIRTSVEQVSCVQEVRELRARQRGSFYLVDLRIAVHPSHTIEAAHDIAHQAENRIQEDLPEVNRVFVHIEPGRRHGLPDCPTCGPADSPTRP